MKKHVLKPAESGAALIAVLVLLATVSMLVMAMAALSQLAVFGTRSDAEYLRSGYIAEGALNRVIWLAAADGNVYNTTDLSTFDYSEYENDRYLPDGVDRELDYYGVVVRYRIENGAGGVSAAGAVTTALDRLTSVRVTDEDALSDARTVFETRYSDYTDQDDLPGVDGMEAEDYEDLGAAPLPRNGGLGVREELWWIPDGVKFFPPDRNGRLTLVNPLGLASSRRPAQPDLFQANYALLTNYGNLSSDDARETLRTLKEFRRDRTVLSEVLDPLLFQNLRSRFSMANSGCYRITIENAAVNPGAASARLDGTFYNPGIETGDGKTLTFHDWMLY